MTSPKLQVVLLVTLSSFLALPVTLAQYVSDPSDPYQDDLDFGTAAFNKHPVDQKPVVQLPSQFNEYVVQQLREKNFRTINPGEPVVDIFNVIYRIASVDGCNAMTQFDGEKFGPGFHQKIVFYVVRAQ